MAILRSTPTVVEDERSKALLFNLIATGSVNAQFEFAEILQTWFHRDTASLALFLERLDTLGLEVRKKK